MRKDSLARKLQNNDIKELWKEVKFINNSRTPLNNNMEGVICNKRKPYG